MLRHLACSSATPALARLLTGAAGIQSLLIPTALCWNRRRAAVAVVDLLMKHNAGILIMLRSGIGSAPIIAPTDIIVSAAINVIGSAFGAIIGPINSKKSNGLQANCSAASGRAALPSAAPAGTYG
jgi:hypothetical protein